MSAPHEPSDDFEARLRAALRAEADPVVPAGDGLARIRARTQRRAGVLAWLTRPAAAGGVLAAALVAAILVGVQLAGDNGHDSVVVEPPPGPVIAGSTAAPIQNDQASLPRYNPTPEPDIGPTGGQTPTVDTQLTPPPTAAPLFAPVSPQQDQRRSDDGIPVDDGHSTYVSIQAPLSGGTYDSPLTLHGQARVFEARLTIDVSQNGTVLKQAHATATAGAPALGDWEATIALDPGAYRIDAYALSPKDGQTRLASDSIWITIRAPGATPTPSPTTSARPTSGPSSNPTAPAAQPGDVPATDQTDQTAGTEPRP